VDISDGDLARLARDGDPVAFRLLVERHQSVVRARAARLCANPSDVDDVVQESFLQAYLALDRLRDPDRFAGWLGGIVGNVCRGLRRRAPLTLLPDWPEPVHPAAADGLPSADDIDRADALRTAVAALPAGQRRAVVLHYYAGLPAGQVAESAGAARASLHKARLRLRAYITEHRPDLVPAASRRTSMTTVRIARAESLIPPGEPIYDRRLSHVLVLADDAGRRELPLWLLGPDGQHLSDLLARPRPGLADPPGEPAGTVEEPAGTAEELAARLLQAAGARVRTVDLDELGPQVTAARIGLAGPAGTRQVTARLTEGLAVAIVTGAQIRVADALLDRLARPAADGGPGRPGSTPAWSQHPQPPRPRYQPRNLAFRDGLDGWTFDGSFAKHASESHWHDYACTVQSGTAVLSSAVPEPAGFALLRQAVFADDYRGATVTFRGEFRTGDTPGRARLFLRVSTGPDISGPLPYGADLTSTGLTSTEHNLVATAGTRDWISRELTAAVPGDADAVVFGIFLEGRGQIEFRHAELVRPR
jgi:RNA polymerase sigma-70 factor (ECF subfamily)